MNSLYEFCCVECGKHFDKFKANVSKKGAYMVCPHCGSMDWRTIYKTDSTKEKEM